MNDRYLRHLGRVLVSVTLAGSAVFAVRSWAHAVVARADDGTGLKPAEYPPDAPPRRLPELEVQPMPGVQRAVRVGRSATLRDEFGEGLSVCNGLPCWGPGEPTIFTRYFRTYQDWASETNAIYIAGGQTIPRDAYAQETLAFHNFNYLAPRRVQYQYVWRNPQGQVYGWSYLDSFTLNGERLAFYSDASGLSYELPLITSIGISFFLNCTVPDGVYSDQLIIQPDGYAPYSEFTTFEVGGTGQCGPSPSPSPTPTPVPTPTPTPVPTPTPIPTPTPLPSSAPSVRPVALGPSGCLNTVTPTLSWTAVPRATEYRLLIIDAATSTHVPVNVPSTSYTIPAGTISPNREYRWRVKGQNHIGDGPYSQPDLSIIPLCGPPQVAPTPLSPLGCIQTLTPTLAWTPVPRAAEYQIHLLQAGSETPVISRRVTGTSYTVPPGLLSADVDYRWKIKATNFSANGTPQEGPYYVPDPAFTPFCGSRPLEEDPGIREPDSGQTPCEARPSAAVGRPVNVATGNMYLDQVDLAVPGVGPDLVFSRSYNSENVAPERYGIFGPGWSHAYEQRLRLIHNTVVTLRQPDGTLFYFRDQNDDRVYEPSVPASEQSTIIRRPDGTFERRFRAGGAQTFDVAGRLASIVDPVGNVTTLTFDSTGRLISIADAGGRALTFTYDGSRLTSVAGPAGLETVAYGYDAANRLSSVTYRDGSGFRFSYDAAGRLLTVTDPTNTILESHTYDGAGRAVSSSVGPGQESYTFVYEPFRTRVTDGLGNVTVYDFAEVNEIKRMVGVSGPCATCGGGGSEAQEWRYDTKGRVTSHRRSPDGSNASTTYFYNLATGDLMFEKDALQQTTAYTYFADGRVKTITRPDGSTKSFTYVTAGPATVTETVAPGETVTTSFTYTPQGKLHTLTDAGGHVTTHAYTAAGDLASTTNAAGTTTYTYDAIGRRIAVTDALGNRTDMRYDGRSRIRRSIPPAGVESETRFKYDDGGRMESSTGPLLRETRFTYDSSGRLSTLTDPSLGVTGREYDAMSRLTATTDANGNRLTFDYDVFGRVTSSGQPGGPRETTTYDNLGRLSTRTDRRGIRTTYTYDQLGRLLGKTYSDDTPDVSYTYDAAGRMLSAESGTDTLTWTYDLLGRMLTETSARNQTTLAYAYDDASNRLSLSLNGALYFTYGYDELSRMTSLAYRDKQFLFGYDALSRRTSLQFPNGVATTYDYDQSSRLVALNALRGGVPISRLVHDYDPAGNRRTRQDLVAPARSASYTYDALNQLLSEARPGTATRYTYDPAGNRVSQETDGLVTTNVHNTRHQIVTSERPGSPATTFAYDDNGNLIRKVDGGVTWTYEWSAENQLERVLRNGTDVVRFTYDPIGRRIEKVAGAETRTYTYDGVDILRDAIGTSVLTYVHGPGIDEPLARQTESDAWRYLHADGLGSIVAVTTPSGGVAVSSDYEAFGRPMAGMPPRVPYGFTGREWDDETGLYYYRARYYDPALGRFISEDPMGLAAGHNPYVYVGNNPVNRVDPHGLDWVARTLATGSDLASGFGDTLSMGLTSYIRRQSGLDTFVNPCSGAYQVGEYAAYLHTAATGVAGVLNGGARSVFYSGEGAWKAALAAKGEGKIMADTLGGATLNLVDKVVKVPDVVWRGASAVFAANAKGEIQVVLRSANPTAIWSTVERPIINFMGNVTKVVYR